MQAYASRRISTSNPDDEILPEISQKYIKKISKIFLQNFFEKTFF